MICEKIIYGGGNAGMVLDVFNSNMSQETMDHLTMLLPLLLQLGGLVFAVMVDSYISKKHKRVMFAIAFLALSLIVQNDSERIFAAESAMKLLRILASIWGYSVRPVILVLFLYIVSPERNHMAAWILAGINAAVYLSALFCHISFWFDENYHYREGPLRAFCLYVSVILLGYLLYLTIRNYAHVRKRELLIPVFNAFLIIAAVLMDSSVGFNEQIVTFLTGAIISDSLFYYIWLHLQFVRKHEKELRDGQRVQIMLSQIRPHFLYNSLGAIEELCESDPQMAKAATVTFSRYLRGNMTSIGASDAIPFEKELSHTRFYLELEQIRFEDALQVAYDISCTDFTIPTLTLEPLVENAVRHGVRGNEDGRGTVTISTREFPDYIEVSVVDDGPGFDPNAVPKDGYPHVGLQNVRERLSQVCGGMLKIESAIGYGTTVAIILPKKRDGVEYDGKE